MTTDVINKIKIIKVENETQLSLVKPLLKDYKDSLSLYLNISDLKKELKYFNREFNTMQLECIVPFDFLFLALSDNKIAAACIALKKINTEICELKRLYVKPCFRKNGLGEILCITVIEKAVMMNYKKIVLDTCSTMLEAIALYKSLGFKEYKQPIKNCIHDTLCMELSLTNKIY